VTTTRDRTVQTCVIFCSIKKSVVIDAKWPTRKKRRLGPTGYLAAVGALLLCVAQVSSARGDSASCIAKGFFVCR